MKHRPSHKEIKAALELYKGAKPQPLSEQEVQAAIIKRLKWEVPGLVIITNPLAAITIHSPATLNKLNKSGHEAGTPDMFLCQARNGFHGMALEIKAENKQPWLKSSTAEDAWMEAKKENYDHYKSEYRPLGKRHAQVVKLIELERQGYYARFGVGLDHCMKLIEYYFGLQRPR